MSKTLILATKSTKRTLLADIGKAADNVMLAAVQRAVLHAENVKYVTERAEWLDTAFLAEQITVTAYRDGYVRFIDSERLFIGDEKTWWVRR